LLQTIAIAICKLHVSDLASELKLKLKKKMNAESGDLFIVAPHSGRFLSVQVKIVQAPKLLETVNNM